MGRPFLGLGLAACILLAYVQQRVTLVTLGYQVERLKSTRDDLLDQHRVLHYNVLILQSPVILSKRLEQSNIRMSPPQQVEILHSTQGPSTRGLDRQAKVVNSALFQQVGRATARWLEGGQQAEAKPVFEEKGQP